MHKAARIVIVCVLILHHLTVNAQLGLKLPMAGSIQTYGKDYRPLASTFYEKDGSTWNLSFIKLAYTIETKYINNSGEKYKGKTLKGDLIHILPDGQRYYLSKINGVLYCHAAILNSEMSKSGTMLVEYEPAKPMIYTDKLGQAKYTARIRIATDELSAKYEWMKIKGDFINLTVDYSISGITVDQGILEVSSYKDRVTSQRTNISLREKCLVESNGRSFEYPLNPFLWPGSLKQEVIWQSYNEVKFFNENYIDAVLKFKQSGKEVVDVFSQVSTDAPYLENDEKSVIAYPNPTAGEIYFDLVNYPKAKYRIEFYNPLGGRVKSYEWQQADNVGLKVNLSDLKRGIYTYSIFDENGKRVVSKRVNLVSS
jgi:hypothetical protein